ncbi:MAG TPA: ethanolamine ammonia-lyase reactivating factor EutA [Alphaproteobacteria bacterium]|jgi:ethanolamine utilization protein EutA
MHDDPFEHGHYGDDDETVFGPIADDGFPSNPDWLRLTSVGIDIGSSTSHLMFSKLVMRRRGHEMSSDFEVAHRAVLHRSSILLTPYSNPDTIDTNKLAAFVERSYGEAGIAPADVDTGAVICTGEAVRKHNSQAIIRMLAESGGKFVCATAGPNLEAALGAHGSGAVTRSLKNDGVCLHVDIGGGTSKLALVEAGAVVETAAVNVGARLIAWDKEDRIIRIEAAGRTVAQTCGYDLDVGHVINEKQKLLIAEELSKALYQVLQRKQLSPLVADMIISGPLKYAGPIADISFSGGVSEYIYGTDTHDYGDLGPLLGAAIRRKVSTLGVPLAGSLEHIRATVIGASQYTVQLSSSTVYVSDENLLPQLDLQVVTAQIPAGPAELTAETVTEAILRGFKFLDISPQEAARPVALALLGSVIPNRASIKALCAGIIQVLSQTPADPWIITLSSDVAGLVGAMLKEEEKVAQDIIVIDGIRVGEFAFIDLGQSIKSVDAVPVVVKSLVFEG